MRLHRLLVLSWQGRATLHDAGTMVEAPVQLLMPHNHAFQSGGGGIPCRAPVSCVRQKRATR